MSGAALYALPLVGLMGKKCGVKLRHAGAAAGVAAALCLPALLGGMTAGKRVREFVQGGLCAAGICGGRAEF